MLEFSRLGTRRRSIRRKASQEVVGIDQKEISGKIQKFYVLRVLDSDMRILVPTDKAEQVDDLRAMIRERLRQLEEVYDILKEKELHIDKQTWNRRNYRGFMEKIKTGSLFEVAEVFRDLYRPEGAEDALVRRAPHARHREEPDREGAVGGEERPARRRIEKELEKLFKLLARKVASLPASCASAGRRLRNPLFHLHEPAFDQ